MTVRVFGPPRSSLLRIMNLTATRFIVVVKTLIPEHLFRGDGTGAGDTVTSVSVRGRVRGMMMGRAGRPLDDGVASARWAIVAAVLASMVPAGRLEVLGLVATAGAAPQEVRTAAAAQEVRAGAGAPLQLLQLGPVVLRGAGHASGGISSVTPAGQASTRASQSGGINRPPHGKYANDFSRTARAVNSGVLGVILGDCGMRERDEERSQGRHIRMIFSESYCGNWEKRCGR